MRQLFLPVCITLSACATPDLTSELDAFSKSAALANTELTEFATPRAAVELDRARFSDVSAVGIPISTTKRAAALANPVAALAEQAARARKYRALRAAAFPADHAIGMTLNLLEWQLRA